MKKLRCPRKREGEWAEVCFWARALWYGLIVSRPYGESSPYDFLVHNGRRIFRVQVRTTSKLAAATNMYRIHARDSVGRTFTSAEIDFIVALVVFDDRPARNRGLRFSFGNSAGVPHPSARLVEPRVGLDSPELPCSTGQRFAWYIIPVSALKPNHDSIWLAPHRPSRACFEQFRDAWQLLR